MKRPDERREPPPAEAGKTSPPATRRHLRRLDQILDTSGSPLFFITLCARHRMAVLAQPAVHDILVTGWRNAFRVYGWMVGRYVVMPDHAHFFAGPATDQARDLSAFVGGWKNWTQRQVRESVLSSFAWQREFFDHLMRSEESYEEKWEYVRANPVRAGLVARAEDWPYQGEIHSLPWSL